MELLLALAFVLATVHLLAGKLRFLDTVPRSRWLSAAGGISVAYVLVHLLPELAELQAHLNETLPAIALAVERHVYVVALVGLAAFYGIEHWSRRSGRDAEGVSPAAMFSFAMYCIYNAVIGYLLLQRDTIAEAVAFAVALGLHFVVNDYGLRQNHRSSYHRYGRWLLSAAVVAGAVIGYATAVSEVVIAGAVAFVGGGTILNVLKEELPEERESRFTAFLAGATLYTALLLLV